MEAKLMHLTPGAFEQITYFARVSNPGNQDNPEYKKLIKYCFDNGHWSIFEHAHASFELVTSRAISAQLLRHRSFTFQEFSQRYATVEGELRYEVTTPRRQDTKNRQNSIDDLDYETVRKFRQVQEDLWNQSYNAYQQALKAGVAKECARMLLPLSTQTKLYMTGNLRSWIHYLQVRLDPATQREHRELAQLIYDELADELPFLIDLLGGGMPGVLG